jgi:hypothetical protein
MPRLEPHDIAWFASPFELHDWLARQRGTHTELWVGMRPKASGLPSVTWPELDNEAEAAIRDAGGWGFWEGQPRTYRNAGGHWVMSAKRPATRMRRLGALVAACAAGERLAELSPRSRPMG